MPQVRRTLAAAAATVLLGVPVAGLLASTGADGTDGRTGSTGGPGTDEANGRTGSAGRGGSRDGDRAAGGSGAVGEPGYVEAVDPPRALHARTTPALLPYAVVFGALDVLAVAAAVAWRRRRATA